ncbi:MAG: RHS repeat-associated core domain-containing protein, partial [bacterium]
LKYQVPPKAVALVGAATSYNVASNSVTDELIYKYTYDSLGRVVEKKEPGAALKCFVFDKLGRVAFTQDGNLKATNQWYFVKYDFLNRPVYSGLFTSTLSRKSLQNQLRIMDLTTLPYYESPAVNATFQGYTNNAFPTTGTTLLTVNYYDSYDFDQNGTADYTYDNTHLAGLPAAASAKVRGLPTGSKKLILGSTNWLVSVVFYDNLDRAIQTQSNNHLNTLVQDKSSVLYTDLVHVDRTKATHTGPSVVTVEQRYTYDPNWRTLGIFHKINGGTEQQLVSYSYNIHGQVVDKKLHVNGAAFLQSVDMRYNIRGWIKSMNNAQLANDANVTNDDTNDYFGMELSYNTAEANSLGNALYYNGNVSAAKWKGPNTSTGSADQRSYKYTYDKSDKLKSATFQANTGAAWTKEAGTLNEMMTYDHNGNMATLQRTQTNRGLNGTTVTRSPLTIDNHTDSYTTNTNRMLKVEDAIATTIGVGDFKNGSTAATEYTYTVDGSQTADLNKGIQTITYNVLNKPQVVTYSGTPTKTVTYTYDAAGTKLKTVTVANSVTTTTDYVNNFVYTNNALSFFSSPEGRVVKNGANYEYQYAIADHQGNTRVLFSSATPTPTTLTATFEGTGGDNSNLFSNVNPTFVVPYGSANNTPAGVKVVRMNQTYSTGPAKSLKVYPGDKVDMETHCYYESASGYGSTNSTVATMLTSIASAFGGVSGGAGESGSIFNGINSALDQIGLAPNLGDGRPSAYLNYILFDQQYKVVDMGWTAVPSTASFAKQKISIPQITVKEAGYMFVYLSYETASNNWVYFDDFKVTQTKTNVLQYNEYYPFNLNTSNSWTRENATANNFLANGGTELNTTTGVYDLDYRNYDPILGRMNQVDPMASQYSSLTPYNYSFNDPVTFNDPDGADPIKKEPLPTDANPDPGTGWGAWHLPGMGGGSSRIGFGHWSDRYSGYFNSMPGWTITIDFNQMRDGTYFGLDFTNGHVSNFTQYSEAVAMGGSFGAMIGASQWVSNYIGGARLWGNTAGTHFSPDGGPVMVSTGTRSPVHDAPDSAIPVYGDFQRASYWADHNDWSRVALYGALAITDMAGITGLAKAGLRAGARYLIKEGVYDLSTTGGRYIGQSKNVIARVNSHFTSTGKLGSKGYGEIGREYFSMPGSSKLQREVYEQYRILNKGGGVENLLNLNNPMGGRMDLYNRMIDDVLSTYKLPK